MTKKFAEWVMFNGRMVVEERRLCFSPSGVTRQDDDDCRRWRSWYKQVKINDKREVFGSIPR